MISEEIKPNKKGGRWSRKNRRKKEREKNQDSYRKTGRLRLQAMFKAGIGVSRSRDKADADTGEKIYSKSTFKTYKNQFRYFSDWLANAHPEVKTLDDARGFVDEYLINLIDLKRSANSITTAKSALAKVFMTESTQFVETPPRLRVNIKRSRGKAIRDKHISNKTEQALARFTSAMGLRRAEMIRIEAEDLFFKDGKAFINVTKGPKGGKARVAEIVGETDRETDEIVAWIQSKQGRLFPKLSSNYDNHSYRGVYAKRVYKKYARDVKKLLLKEKYIMRADRAGETFDRSAMLIASRNLGHNRVSVIAQSYLYTD